MAGRCTAAAGWRPAVAAAPAFGVRRRAGRSPPARRPRTVKAPIFLSTTLMLLRLPCGVEARSGYPAASRHAAATLRRQCTQRLLRARSQPLTIMERSRWTGGVDLHGVAARRPRRTTRPHAPFRSIALRNLRSQLLELGVAAGKLLGWRLNQDASANLCANEFVWYLMSSSSWPPRVQNLSNNLTTEEAVLRA